MSYHTEHLAWQQRVGKELGESRRFNQVMEQTSLTPSSSYKHEMQSYFFPNKTASSSQYIMPFTRMNRDYRDKKKLNIYVNDSSHVNPSDPNTMRDQGQVRNSPYAFDIHGYSQTIDETGKQTMAGSWKGFPSSVKERATTAYVSGHVRNRDVQNQSFYRFGGTTSLSKHVDRIDETPKLNSTFHTILSKRLKQRLADYNESKKVEATVYDKDSLVRVQDYTKNVSQGIFAPSINNKAIANYKTLTVSPMTKFGYRFNQTEKKHERDIVKSLKKKLDHERSIRHSITREVEGLKQTLNSLK